MRLVSKQSFVRLMYLISISQTATVSTFKAPIPKILHLFKFGFKLVKEENISNGFSNSLTEFSFFQGK